MTCSAISVLFDSTNIANYWIFITLEGSKSNIENGNEWTQKSNRSAIGARVYVHINDKIIMREVIAGKGHGSMDPLQLHVGLGNNSNINYIEVHWPSMDMETEQPKISN